MMAPTELTEKLLIDAGGWQAMKQARLLVAGGAVGTVTYEPPFLRGGVREGGRELKAGLRIVSRTNVENLCSCRASREWGTICAHSLAVGLAQLGARTGETAPALKVKEKEPNRSEVPGPRFVAAGSGAGELVRFNLILPPKMESAIAKGRFSVVLEAEVSGRRVLANALDKSKTYQCSSADLALVQAAREAADATLQGMFEVEPAQFTEFLEKLQYFEPRITLGRGAGIGIPALLAMCGSSPVQETVPVEERPRAAVRFELELEGSLNHLTAILNARYGDRQFRVGSAANPNSPVRDFSAENAASGQLVKAGFSQPDSNGLYILKGERSILRFYALFAPKLESEWTVRTGSRYQNVTRNIERVTPRMAIRPSGSGWFELDLDLTTPSGERFSAAEIHRLLQSGQNHVRLKNDRTAVFDDQMLDDLQNVLRDCDPQQVRPGTYRISQIHAGVIAEVGQGTQLSAPAAWSDWAASLRDPSKLPHVPLGELESILRPYQKQGVNWLHFLAENKMGGILADEMGLGKTLQALAFLSTLDRGLPSLVICPSSLVFNWHEEARRFTPRLRCIRWEGSDRRRDPQVFDSADIVLTSYGLLRRDADWLRTIRFNTVILDEAQHVKNPEAQAMQAAMALQTERRFVLTGTPVENRLGELWSVMNFAMPGFLGTRREFRERYEQTDAVDQQASARLVMRRVKPFLLRRQKNEAAPELPEKIEQVSYCELSAHQAEIYKGLLEKAWSDLDNLRKTGTEAQRRFSALSALLRLRQTCCDPRLLPLQSPGSPDDSAKLNLLGELLDEALDGDHKVLVFSQFTSMLRLISEELSKREIAHCYLDGETRDRAVQVSRFQSDPSVPVFLISLKAGGVGLNLQAADTVIHYDPWWNPAVEAQATDRAHRIGQKRVVTSYKLIARGTIEERIIKLQEQKRELFEAIVGATDVESGQSLTPEDLEALLR